VQADWNAIDGDAAILNKPTNLVTSDAIKDVVKTDSTFIYTPAEKDAETNEEIKSAET
jgi:hypothetical protein